MRIDYYKVQKILEKSKLCTSKSRLVSITGFSLEEFDFYREIVMDDRLITINPFKEITGLTPKGHSTLEKMRCGLPNIYDLFQANYLLSLTQIKKSFSQSFFSGLTKMRSLSFVRRFFKKGK